MPLTLTKLGSALGGNVNELALARHPDPDGPHLLTARRLGNEMHVSYWDFLEDGDLFESPLVDKAGGLDAAMAAYNAGHALLIHRDGVNPNLRVEAWDTGGFFELDDDHLWTNDTAPEIVPFGAGTAPALASVMVRPGGPPRPIRVAVRPQPSPGTAGPGSSTGSEPGPKIPGLGKMVAAGTASTSIGPKVGRVVVASRTVLGQLRLTLWGFDAGGQIHTQVGKWAEAGGGPVEKFSIAKVKEHWSADGKFPKGVEVVVALVASDGKLKLQRWKLDLGGQGTPASFTKLSEATAPEVVTLVSCCPVDAFGGTQLVTAVRVASGGTLKVIGWKMEAGGGMTRVGDAAAGAIDQLKAAHVRGRVFVTATRESDERFKANYWLFPNLESGAMTAQGNAVEGKIAGWVECVHVPGVAQHLGDTVFGVKGEDGKLVLWRYAVTE